MRKRYPYPKLTDLMTEGSNLINEFLGDLSGLADAALDVAGDAAEMSVDAAVDVLKTPAAQKMMNDMIKQSGADEVGIDLFKKMFPKSGEFLKYLEGKGVDKNEFAIAFGIVLVEKAADEGVKSIPSTISNANDKLADVAAESVVETLEGMNVKFGAELFGKTIPGTDTLEKNTLEDKTRKAVKEAIKPVLIQGQQVKIPPGIVKEGLSRGSLYRLRYYGRY
tara:strand:+ start:948 stop:1613 length:666 start_codon:yes stop_codon:yes gene_type:complete